MKWYSFATIMEYEFDPAKSAANRDKHGIGFEQASLLWSVFGATLSLPFPFEERWLRVAELEGKHWSAVFTIRNGKIRLISIRRSRKDEVHAYEQAKRGKGEHDHQP